MSAGGPGTADLFSFATAAPPAKAAGTRANTPLRAVPPAPAPRPAAAVHRLLDAGPPAWQRLLAQLPDVPIVIVASALWTGVVREVLAGPGVGRKALYKDGVVGDLPGEVPPGRDIFMTPAQAAALASNAEMVLLGVPGTCSARFQFRAGAESGPQVLAVLADLQAARP